MRAISGAEDTGPTRTRRKHGRDKPRTAVPLRSGISVRRMSPKFLLVLLVAAVAPCESLMVNHAAAGGQRRTMHGQQQVSRSCNPQMADLVENLAPLLVLPVMFSMRCDLRT